jgi:hypothetical protein
MCVAAEQCAFGVETSRASGALALATSTLAPATTVTAIVNCPNAKKGDVLVQWSSSPSAFTTGYTVTRAVNGGTPVAIATVAASVTSYDDTTVAGSTTYGYAVVATYRNWTSTPASAPAVTTAKRC